MNSEDTREYGLDLLKAISILLVLAWHLKPFYLVQTGIHTASYILISYVVNIFYKQITLLAVPVFYLVSIFLFFRKADLSLSYCRQRLFRISYIMLFWVSVQFLLFSLMTGSWPKDDLLMTIMAGGPNVPIIGESVFYFLVVLMILTLITMTYARITDHAFLRMVDVLLIVSSLAHFEYQRFTGTEIPFWRIDSFLLYVPAAHLYFSLHSRRSLRWPAATLLVLYLLFTIVDIHMSTKVLAFPIYARASVFCGASALFCCISSMKFTRRLGPVLFLSRYSLGIFALHKYALLLLLVGVTHIVNVYSLSRYLSISVCYMYLSMFILGVVTIFITCAAAYLLGLTPFRKLVS